MLILDPEKRPHASAADFREADEEAENGRVLELASVDGVKDPIEAEDGVNDHREIIYPRSFVSKHIPEEGMCGVGITKT